MPKKPILLMTFAANDLPAVRNEAEKTWKALENHSSVEAIKLEDVEIDDLTTTIIKKHQDMLFFHFGGHINQHGVVLDNLRDLDKIRFSRLIMPRKEHKLQWVFLSGCLSYGHVGLLTAKGVKAIIATNVEVSDVDAARLATYFYESFFNGGFTLKEAFEMAETTVIKNNSFPVIVNPGEIDENQPMPSSWTLFVHTQFTEVLDWTLDDFLRERPLTTSTAKDEHNTRDSHNLTAIIFLIDTDMVAAFDALDKIDWGNKRGQYIHLKQTYVDLPVGLSKAGFTDRLKVFVKSHLQ